MPVLLNSFAIFNILLERFFWSHLCIQYVVPVCVRCSTTQSAVLLLP